MSWAACPVVALRRNCGPMIATVMEDVGAVVGYRAASILSYRYGGQTLYVPASPRPGHPLALLIGPSALRALVAEWGGESLRIPQPIDEVLLRNRRIFDMLLDRTPVADIAASVGLTVRRVEQLRADLVERGWVDYCDPGGSGSDPLCEAYPAGRPG